MKRRFRARVDHTAPDNRELWYGTLDHTAAMTVLCEYGRSIGGPIAGGCQTQFLKGLRVGWLFYVCYLLPIQCV